MVVSPSPADNDRTTKFARLMRLGQVSFVEGNRKQAHRFWRRAAMMKPTDEQVWVALLQVLEDDEDRRVCLQNIIAINPNNAFAQRQLNGYYDDTEPARPVVAEPGEEISPARYLVLRAVEVVMFSILIVTAVTAARFIHI